jgi:hypothetical protein
MYLDNLYQIQVIHTQRSNNSVYMAFGKNGKMTNWIFPLDKVEEYMGCVFEDGDHPFVSCYLDNGLSVWDWIDKKER